MSQSKEFEKTKLQVAAQVFAALHVREDAPETAITSNVAGAAKRAIQAAQVFCEVWFKGDATYRE
jgi:hypothetical protein